MITAGGRCAGNQRARVISWVYALSSQNAATARPMCRVLPYSGEPRYKSVARNLRVFTGSGEARTGGTLISRSLDRSVASGWQAGPRTAGAGNPQSSPLLSPWALGLFSYGVLHGVYLSYCSRYSF